MFKKMIKHLKDCFKKGVDIYMNGQEIKAKTLVESLEIGADLLKSAGKGLCGVGRGIHTTIHEIINGVSSLAKKTTETKENCLMTAVISAGVGLTISAAYFIRANSFDKV